MFGVNNIIFDENITELSEQERFKIINSKKLDPKVLEYLIDRFKNLKIEICGDHEGTLIELMKKGFLEGWCWQTTESSIIFLNDDDYIERGNLKFTKYQNYYHSWICFKFENKDYVLDSCLDLLCDKELYYKIFEIEVKGRTTAKQVRDSLIDSINNPKKKDYSYLFSEESIKATERFMKSFFGEDYKERKSNEVVVTGNNDVTAPMYRNNTGYKAEIENGQVKKLVAHYYMNG